MTSQRSSELRLDDESRARAAADLAAAERDRKPIAPLTETFRLSAVADAYAIQRVNIDHRISAGASLVGHKVGLTAKAMQEMLGVYEPDFGQLLSDMVHEDGATLPIERYIQARVELEIAFVLAAPLAGPGVTVDDVLRATEVVLPALEIIDSRIADWRITLCDTVADNASSAGVVLGSVRTPVRDIDLKGIDAALEKNGVVEAEGASSAVLGDPALAVAWLANTLAEFGTALEPGQVIMPGACTRAIDVAAGDVVRARLATLGEVTVAFT